MVLRALLMLLGACGGGAGDARDGGPLDGGTFDASPSDASPLDAAVLDAAWDAFAPLDASIEADAALDADIDDGGALVDAAGDAGGSSDGSVTPLPGFGTVLGPCGRVEPEIDASTPSFLTVRFDFADDRYDMSDFELLTDGAQRLMLEPNEGGNSQVSEAFAYEILERCEGATMLVETERGVTYVSEMSKKTDLVAFIDENVGVSVTRAFVFSGGPYPLSEAQRIVGGKLDDILVSTANAVDPMWDKQILVVMADNDDAAARVREAWDGFTAERRADTIVYVVITDGDDGPIYNR